MPRKKSQPAEGGAVGGGEGSSPEPVRGPIKDMLAGGSEDDFKDSLPAETSSEDTSSSPEASKPRRKRRSKEEIAREKGRGDAPTDERLERAKAKASGLGGAALVKSGFTMAAKPLNSQEEEDLDDQFYLIANKAGIDPTGSWLFLIIYTVALIARLIMVRTQLGEEVGAWIKEMFKPKEKEEGATVA
jgi:hypothetical protein